MGKFAIIFSITIFIISCSESRTLNSDSDYPEITSCEYCRKFFYMNDVCRHRLSEVTSAESSDLLTFNDIFETLDDINFRETEYCKKYCCPKRKTNQISSKNLIQSSEVEPSNPQTNTILSTTQDTTTEVSSTVTISTNHVSPTPSTTQSSHSTKAPPTTKTVTSSTALPTTDHHSTSTVHPTTKKPKRKPKRKFSLASFFWGIFVVLVIFIIIAVVRLAIIKYRSGYQRIVE